MIIVSSKLSLTRLASNPIQPSVAPISESHPDLIAFAKWISASAWLDKNDLEPVVGHPDCPGLADEHGIPGTSCYTVFVKFNEGGTYGCRYESCSAFRAHSLDNAIRHQRYYHFYHRPFVCIPSNGKSWYVKAILCYPLAILFLLLYLACKFTHNFLAAINDSPL